MTQSCLNQSLWYVVNHGSRVARHSFSWFELLHLELIPVRYVEFAQSALFMAPNYPATLTALSGSGQWPHKYPTCNNVYNLGRGVGRGLGVGSDRGVGVGLGVGVAVAVGVTVAVAVGVGVAVAVAVGVGVGVPPPVGNTRT